MADATVTNDATDTSADDGQQSALLSGGVDAPEDEKAVEGDAQKQDASSTDQDDSSGDTDDEDKSGAPETYSDFSLPEGFEADEQMLGEFGDLARELNLSQEQAQKLVDYGLKRDGDMRATIESAQADQVAGWVESVKTDKEIGGANLNENLSAAKKAYEAFASDELKAMMEAPSEDNPMGMGLGNHPEVIRFFCRVGQQMSEDKAGAIGAATDTTKTQADTLYPDMN